MGISKQSRPILCPQGTQSVIPNAEPDYSTSEVQLNQKWIDGSTIYRKVVDIGSLPDNSSSATAHGITGIGTVIRLHGYVSDGTTQFPLPTAGSAWSIFITVDATNVNATAAGAGEEAFSGSVIIEYTKA